MLYNSITYTETCLIATAKIALVTIHNGTLSLANEWQPGVQRQLSFPNSPMSYSDLMDTSAVSNCIQQHIVHTLEVTGSQLAYCLSQ